METINQLEMAYKDEDSDLGKVSCKTFLDLFRNAKNILLHRQQPTKISLIYMRNCLRLLGFLPRSWKFETFCYKFFLIIVTLSVNVFALTITWDLFDDSRRDIFELAEDGVAAIASFLIFSKMLLTAYNAEEIARVTHELVKVNKYFSQMHKLPSISKIHKLQRIFFLLEIASIYSYHVMCVILSASLFLSPLLTRTGRLPFRAKFPYLSNTYSESPVSFIGIYIFQSIMALYIAQALLAMDALNCNIFNEITLNLKIFCLWIKDLGADSIENRLKELHKIIQFHQYMIRLVARINAVYYYEYICQIIASTLLICLVGFVTMLAKDEPVLAIKFYIFLFALSAEIFYWCCAGNMVYYTSLDISQAAFEIDRWYEESKEFKNCLKFFILRAQTPLYFQPKPLMGFNFETFVKIFKTSYSYYALLRTMND